MTNINYSLIARSDAMLVLALVSNGELDRALTHARLLVTSIEAAMDQMGITPTQVHIHDTTPVA